MSDDRTKEVRSWPSPKNQSELRSFLGLASYYQRFVKDFAKTADPLHKLTSKDAKKNFRWTPEHEEVFKELKSKLCSPPILSLPDFDPKSSPFILDTDASDSDIGGVLIKKDEENNERVIAFLSQVLPKQMRKKLATQREFYAVYQFVKYFRHYLGYSNRPQGSYLAIKYEGR